MPVKSGKLASSQKYAMGVFWASSLFDVRNKNILNLKQHENVSNYLHKIMDVVFSIFLFLSRL